MKSTQPTPSHPARRDILKGAVAASVAALASRAAGKDGSSAAVSSSATAAVADPTLIKRENAKPGAADWQLTRVRVDASGIRSPGIEGYCSRQSVKAGDTLDIMISMNPPGRCTLEVFRMGYYGGRGARTIIKIDSLEANTQPDPPVGPKRLRECKWEPTVKLKIEPDWPSGVYLGRLTRITESDDEAPWQSYVIFIVKDDRPADILFQCSDNTWQAYNRWPSTFSLYDTDDNPWALNDLTDVSFDRPYGKYRQIYDNPQSVGSGEFLCWEFPLCYFLEQHGYDVTYCSNSDLLTPDRALRCKTFISVGHDEYWDVRQYASVRRMIDSEVSALFLSGNSICFVAPMRPSSTGAPNRIINRSGRYGGLTETEKDKMGPFSIEGPNEGLIMGARTIEPFNGGGDWIVRKPDHWLFDGTHMKSGDRIPGLVGWEFHGNPADIPGLEVVADGIALSGGTKPAHWTATVYPGASGKARHFVFNAATIFWAQGLSSPPGHMLPWSHFTRPHGPDARVQRITHNALRRSIT